jgi:hypothetical protein
LTTSAANGISIQAESSYVRCMAEPYSLKWFLLHAKQELLGEFFHRWNLLLEVPFAGMADGETDIVFSAIQALQPDHREQSEAYFQEIYQMANRTGVDAIIAASRSKHLSNSPGEDLVQRLGGMASNLDRAFWTFLHRPQHWELAGLLASADSIGPAAWEKHPKVPRVSPRIDDDALKAFGAALGHYFHTMEGRGHRCDVKVCDRGGGLLYVFCLLEQPSRADAEWGPEGLRRRTHRPAQPLTFMYSQEAGELDTYLRAKARVVWDVTAIFARHVLGLKKLEPPPKGHGVYQLDNFKRRGTVYRYGPESGISTVAVRRLRLTPRFGPKLHIILEANPTAGNEPVYDTLERDLRNLFLNDVDVTQVELKVVFDRTTHRNRRTVSPTITVPNRCSLGYDDRELIVRKMLIASGIELKTSNASGVDC